MDSDSQFDPIARILVNAYGDAIAFSREFRDEFGIPPTAMTKAHFMRSVTQARVAQADGLTLGTRFAEFGRVEIAHAATGQRFVLRSNRHLAIESRQFSLFDSILDLKPEVELLVYDFSSAGLTLARVEATMKPPSTTLYAAGPARYIGLWPFEDPELGTFDQDLRDPFEDLGDADIDEAEDDGS